MRTSRAKRARAVVSAAVAAASLLLSITTAQGAGACQRVLMFDGPSIKTENNAQEARYWGKTIGLGGLFLNDIMDYWQVDVGNDPHSPVWVNSQNFQRTYAQEGVTDNFIKVAIWRPHDWHDSNANAAVVRNFGHAAALARFAGFRGIAMDLEPYDAIWGGEAGGPELAPTVEQMGRQIAQAMRAQYPDMTFVVIDDAIHWANLNQGYHGGYGLSVPFLKGLLGARFAHVVIAEEQTYKEDDFANVVQFVRGEYAPLIAANGSSPATLSISPGLWPLGLSAADKSARRTPDEFRTELRAAAATSPQYEWIYGFGSAWEANGAYGKSALAPNFAQYADALRNAPDKCH